MRQIAAADAPQMSTTEEAKMDSASLLGHSAGWWDSAMLISLGIAAVVAFVVAGATAGSVVANKREAASAKAELERYKAGASERTARAVATGETAKADAGRANEAAGKANERAASLEKEAADARLQTEKLKSVVAWRSFSPAEAAALEAALKAHPGPVNLRYADGDPEALYLAIQLAHLLNNAGWRVAPGSSKLAGAIIFGFALPDGSTPDGKALRAAFTKAKIKFSEDALPPVGAEFNVSTIDGAPTLMVGSKRPEIP